MDERLDKASEEPTDVAIGRGSRVANAVKRVLGPGITNQSDYLKKIEAVRARQKEIEEQLNRRYPGRNPNEINLLADERAHLEDLCTRLDALPRDGLKGVELKSLGFELYDRDSDHGILRPVIFPQGWTMEPENPEPELTEGGHANVLDERGEKRVHVLFRLDPSSGYPSGSSTTTLVQND